MPQEIEIYIDKIVLDGFDRMNVADLQLAIQEHLVALVATQGLPDGLGGQSNYDRLNGGQINLDTNQKAGQVGSGIAGGIYQGIKSIT